MKKRIVALALCALMLTSLFCFASCGAKEVDDIDGKTPEEVFMIAMQQLEEHSEYEVHLGMEMEFKLWIVPLYTINVEHMVTYAYDGADQMFRIVPEAVEQLEEEDMGDIFYGFDDEIIYVDGVCYVKNGSNKEKFSSETTPIEKSDYEKAVGELLAENAGEVRCYRDGDLYYFTIEITDEDELKLDLGDNELYTVYLDEDGRIEKITVESDQTIEGLAAQTIMTADYIYEDLEGIKAPSDASSYTSVSNDWWY